MSGSSRLSELGVIAPRCRPGDQRAGSAVQEPAGGVMLLSFECPLIPKPMCLLFHVVFLNFKGSSYHAGSYRLHARRGAGRGGGGSPVEGTPPPAPSSLALLKSVLEKDFLRILLEKVLCCLKIYSKTSTLKPAGARTP